MWHLLGPGAHMHNGDRAVFTQSVTLRHDKDRARTAPQGIEPGDVIIAVEGKTVDSVSKLLAYLDDFQVADTVGLSVKRGDTTRVVAATLQPGV